MPVYLLHGFRWPRPAIRIHVIVNNLDDAAPEWLVAPETSRTLKENFQTLFPDIMTSIPHIRFVEQYDPTDEITKNQPYAYVADIVHEIKLGADVDEIRKDNSIEDGQPNALSDLRDKLATGEKMGWYVVVCGDEERSYSNPTTPIADEFSRRSNGTWFDDTGKRSATPSSTQSREGKEQFSPQRHRSNSITRGLRKILGKAGELKRSRSLKDLKNPNAMKSYSSTTMTPQMPPLPGTAR